MKAGPVPRRPVLSPQRDPDRPAPAPRAGRGHPAAGDPLPREVQRSTSTPPVTEIDSEAMQALLEHAGRATSASWRTRSRRPSRWPTARSSTATTCPRPSRPGRAGRATRHRSDRHRPPPPDLTDDLIGQVERDYFADCSRSTRATSPDAPRTAGCRAGASPRSSRSTASTAPGSSAGEIGSPFQWRHAARLDRRRRHDGSMLGVASLTAAARP